MVGRVRKQSLILLLTSALISVVLPATVHGETAVDLSLSTDAPVTIHAGEIVSLRLTLRNLSPVATSARLFGRFPGEGGPTPILALSIDGAGSDCGVDRDFFGCAAIPFAAGEEKIVTVRIVARTSGTHRFLASLTTNDSDPNPSNNSLDVSVTVRSASLISDLELKLEAPPRVPFGQPIRQRYVIENRGPDRAERVILRIWNFFAETLQSPPAGCAARGQIVICDVAALSAGSSTSVDLEFAAPPSSPPFGVEAEAVPVGSQDPSHAFVAVTTGVGVSSDYETLLIPVGNVASGAFDSSWVTQLTFASDRELFPRTVPTLNQCQITCPPNPDPRFGVRIDSLLRGPGGVLLHVDRRDVEHLHFHLRVFDTSRSDENFGTTIPVVRERDLETERLVLQNVPTEEGFRAALRVFDADARAGGEVRVRFFSMHSSMLLAEISLPLNAPAERDPQLGLPLEPGFAMIDNLLARLPELSSVRGSLLIEVTPSTPGLRFWAFASVTNNATQHVTVITPR